ncbi:bifunctional RNase H/acid phosphatase [Sinosporangium siamense]|uniref:Bifunctional RNase H/acid phosphatase n=1 Tax=Sinosporangium siamense TaxID=1367973 RepID=A0A919RFP9_9ACTN|nr:bifunctional RNase H/acid phosphatase [Sinosporangium siamense]GII91940.1 bifunctional RNase H/acid phosphatase [Sinosporangium siamense]
MTTYLIEADGGSRGNPGPAGYGAVVKDAAGGRVLAEVAEAIGTATNNVAEYRGLIAGLTALLDHAGDGAKVEVRMDSKLVIEQMAGRWKVKHEGLKPLALEAAGLARRLKVTWKWIPRADNSHADRLANEAMDAAAEGLPWTRSASSDVGLKDVGLGQASSDVGLEDVGLGQASSDVGLGRGSDVGLEDVGLGRGSGARQEESDQRPGGQEAGSRPGTEDKSTGWAAPPTRTATTLLLLRHGQTPLSIERRFSGLGDAELTAEGIAQAEAAATRFTREPYKLDAIISSPLKRARVTAELIATHCGIPLEIDDGLRETDFGAWEGHTFAEVQERWPGELTTWLADPAAAPPGGESFTVTARRVESARDRILQAHPGANVLVVSHVTPIKLLVRLALLAPPAALYRMHLDVACLSRIDYYSDGPAVLKYLNDTSHLH